MPKKPKVVEDLSNLTVEQKLDRVLSRVDVLEKENKLLKSVADNGRMENVLKKTRKQPTPIVDVTMFDDKVVIGWKSFIDDVYKDSDGVWHEKQIYQIFFEDETKKEIPLLDFFRKRSKVPAKVLKRIVLNEEEMADSDIKIREEDFKLLLLDEDREITINGAFVN